MVSQVFLEEEKYEAEALDEGTPEQRVDTSETLTLHAPILLERDSKLQLVTAPNPQVKLILFIYE